MCGTYSLGDVNDDGKIDSTDASAVLKEYSCASTSKESYLTDTQKKAADVIHDSVFDANDASKLLAYYSGLSTGSTYTMKEYLLTH